MRAPGESDPQLILARQILLDALHALGPQRDAFVLVGAQAIYLHVGEAGIAVAPLTSDGDLSIEPDLLSDDPSLSDLMKGANFSLMGQPGMWMSERGVRVDFMVPATLGKRSDHRAADLGPHGKNVARQARGLEATLVDNSVMTIDSLDSTDGRSFPLRVAGPAALLVAKLHKLEDRRDEKARLLPKDALDVLRLLRGTATSAMATTLARLARDERCREITVEAMRFLEAMFGRPDAGGSVLAAEAVRGLDDMETIARSCAALTEDLLKAFKSESAES